MADPCAQLVVPRGIEVEKAATELLHPCAPLGCFCACFRRYAGFTRTFGKEPNRAAEDFAVCIGCSAHFLAGHWVAGEKSGLVGLVVVTGGMLAENSFHAADVGYELMWLQNTSELFQVFENAENRAAEQNQIALGGGCQRFFGNYVDRREAQCGRCLSRIAVPSDDRSAEAVLAQRHSHGASDQAGAENGDALDGHATRSSSRRRRRSRVTPASAWRTARGRASAHRRRLPCLDSDALRSASRLRPRQLRRVPSRALCRAGRRRATDRRASADATVF